MTSEQKIRECAESIHKASASAITAGTSRGMEGYSLTIGQAQEILTRHFGQPEQPDKSLEEIVLKWAKFCRENDYFKVEDEIKQACIEYAETKQ